MTTMYNILNDAGIRHKIYPDGFSIEIEAEFKRGLSDDDHAKFPTKLWATHADGSLRNVGMEFVTKLPLDLNTCQKTLEDLLTLPCFTDNKNYIETSRASTHVHVNIQRWTKEDLLKFLLVYYLCELQLNKIGGKYREGNLFCLSLSDAEDVMKAIELVVDERFSTLQHQFDNYKYSALNIASIARLGTVEFRQYKGTRSVEEIRHWLSVINQIINTSKQYKTYDDILRVYINNPHKFISSATLSRVINLEEVDSNFSFVFNILNYINTFPERQKKKAASKKLNNYRFGLSERDQDLPEEFRNNVRR